MEDSDQSSQATETPCLPGTSSEKDRNDLLFDIMRLPMMYALINIFIINTSVDIVHLYIVFSEILALSTLISPTDSSRQFVVEYATM